MGFMFEKKRLIGLAVFVLLAVALIGVVGADKGIMAINKAITFPVDGEIYTSNVSYFNWTLYSTSHPLENCYYNLNSGTDIYFNCSIMSVNFSSTLFEGAYSLLFSVNNTFDVNSETIYFYVDTIAPNVSFVSPTEVDRANLSQNYVVANVSVVEGNPQNITYILYNSSWSNVSVFSMANQYSNTSINWSGLADGTYYYNVSVVDVAGRFGSTETRAISLDTVYPLISYTNATEDSGANLSQNFIFVEVNVTELNEKNISFNLYRDISGLVLIDSEGLNGQRMVNWTNLSDGTYYYNVTVEDYAGNSNSTETRIINLDSNPPSIILVDYPQNNKAFDFEDNDKFVAFNVSDNFSSIGNCSFISDLLNLTNDSISSIDNSFNLSNLSSGGYNWSIECADSFGNIGVSGNYVFTILANSSFFEGTNSTNLSAEDDITNVSNYFVQNGFGMINWSEPLDLFRGLDWARYINISLNRVEVDSVGAPELNKSAVVVLYNITWANPQIMKNGEVCSDCSILSYENGTLIFNVTGFSVYTSEETPSRSTSSGGGGGSGSSCVTSWVCSSWSDCLNGVQSRNCSKKVERCAIYSNKPVESQTCVPLSLPESNKTVAESNESGVENESSGDKRGFLSTITGAVIGGGRVSYMILIALALIAGAYGFVYLKRQRLRKSLYGKVLVKPYDLREVD